MAQDASEAVAFRLISKVQETCRKILAFPEGQPARPQIAPRLLAPAGSASDR
ncbi:hypothetical protein [Candidimonas humi]|uniref:Uncharacterized protein n=1 Tax=Candidimonas humi TaxID=683355 RepID=A0ABV8NVR5_9BURK